MLHRINSFFDWFNISEPDRIRIKEFSERASSQSKEMMHLKDCFALASILFCYQPENIFEIGTYLGSTSNFFLELLPNCKVVSVCYVRPFLHFLRKDYNNIELPKKEIGRCVTAKNRKRFYQLYGDSHKLQRKSLLKKFGTFDLVFIDGDHSREGVRNDTELAKTIIGEKGIICWHDANPKEKYLPVRKFLEKEMSLKAIATTDDYVGGIACWSRDIGKKLGS